MYLNKVEEIKREEEIEMKLILAARVEMKRIWVYARIYQQGIPREKITSYIAVGYNGEPFFHRDTVEGLAEELTKWLIVKAKTAPDPNYYDLSVGIKFCPPFDQKVGVSKRNTLKEGRVILVSTEDIPMKEGGFDFRSLKKEEVKKFLKVFEQGTVVKL